MSLIKGGFSHRRASNRPVWQRSYTDHSIRDRADYQTRRTYIHQNPLRARLTPTPKLYRYSSAKPDLVPL